MRELVKQELLDVSGNSQNIDSFYRNETKQIIPALSRTFDCL